MVDTLLARFLIVLAILSLSLPAQIEIEIGEELAGQQIAAGSQAVAPKFGKWLRGEPVAHGVAEAPSVTVFAFYTGARGNVASGATLAGDGDYLSELQRRYAERGARFVAVVADDTVEIPDHLKPCSVVADKDGATTLSWFGEGFEGRGQVVALDRDAQVVFVGELGCGLADAIEHTFQGKLDVAEEQERWQARMYIDSSFDSMVGASAQPMLAPLLAYSPRDGRLLALSYLTAAAKLQDRDSAKEIRESAIERLANESRPLAVFADLALRGDPAASELATRLAAALVPATAAAPHDVLVQLAYLRALVISGKARHVGRQAMLLSKVAFTSAGSALAFGEILTHDAKPAGHRDLCEQAIAKAEELGADPRLLTALKFTVAKRCADDAVTAKALLDDYAAQIGERVSLNNDCWYLMTDLETMGRYGAFAAALADKMLENREQMDSFEFDTAGLAMFVGGRFAEAVEMQELAISKGGQGNPEYAERLARFRAALAAQPAGKQPAGR